VFIEIFNEMAVNMEGSQTHFYDEIEPFCRWRRTEDIDILELHLPSGTTIISYNKFITKKIKNNT